MTYTSSLPDNSSTYVGSQKCLPCHKSQYQQWQNTPHAHAFETLIRAGKQEDVACLRCHVTGFAKVGGFDPKTAEPASLRGVQCEVCHGPGANHIRKAERGLAATIDCSPCDFGKICITCHNRERSPDFNFKKALKEVKHSQKNGD